MHPEYSLTLKKLLAAQNATTDNASSQFDSDLLIKKVIDKITQQWKSIKTAFTKINTEKKKYIDKLELKIALKNLGFYLDSSVFNKLYDIFDYDKDGQISYQDFKATIGEKIQPEEFLYFRQDNPSTIVLTPREQRNCWKELPNVKHGDNPFQFKTNFSKASTVINKLKQDVGVEGWNSAMTSIKRLAMENQLVKWDDFEVILKANGRSVLKQEIEVLKQVIGEFSQNGSTVNVNKLEFLSQENGESSEANLLDEDENECKDFCTVYGYLSKTREEKITEILSEEQFIKILYNYSLKDNENYFPTAILKSIKSIDVDKNGYITYLELSNCLKSHYEKELFGKSINHIF